MPVKDLEFYSAAKAGRAERDLSLDVLSLSLVHQLATLVGRVLQVSDRKTVYFDQDDHLREGRSHGTTVWRLLTAMSKESVGLRVI